MRKALHKGALALLLASVALPAAAMTVGVGGTVGISQQNPGVSNAVQTLPGSTSAVTQATASNLQAQVQGNVAAGSTESGNPVTAGCDYNSALASQTSGTRVPVQCIYDGSLRSAIVGGAISTKAGVNANSIFAYAFGSNSAYYPLGTSPFLYNGATQDQAFTCPNTAAVNVTAGNTTQIVGLSGSTVVRVCSITLSMSAAGTMGVYTGTGTNCGTSTATLIQDMTLATGTPLAQSAPEGGALVRSSAGGEICIKAVTGNVTGSLTYAQF